MNKRLFFAASACGAPWPWPARAAPAKRRSGSALLTVAGAIGRSNHGPLDPALDQLLAKPGASFDKAWEFDAAMLARLPAVAIEPTLDFIEVKPL